MKQKTNDKIKDFVTPYIGELFPGCIAGCVSANKRYVIAAGTQDLLIPIEAANMFDIASVTKALLHVLTLKLIPLSDLDQKINTLVPITGKYRDRITVRHLLSFAVEYGDVTLSDITDKKVLMDVVMHGDLNLLPGTSFRYTNISSMLLTFFLETMFKTPFDLLLRRHLLIPLGMNNTFFSDGSAKYATDRRFVPTQANLDRGMLQDESARLYGLPVGSAGLFSCMDDLLTFAQLFLREDSYLPKDVIMQMQVSQFKNAMAESFGLGMGFRHQNECDLCDSEGMPLKVLKKNGYSGVHLCVMPQNDFAFVVFGNICFPHRASEEKRNKFSKFHRELIRRMYENREELLL